MFHSSFPQANPSNKTNYVMIDFSGTSLNDEDRELLSHPAVGSVILFTRNYQNPEQLKKLCAEIHAIKPEIKIAVDHEGGRVQRFRDGFTIIPPMQTLNAIYKKTPTGGITSASTLAHIMAEELINCGVDFTFAPVVDLDFGKSEVIGNRAFSNSPEDVVVLAQAFNAGLHKAGMPTIGKHFPGHGFVCADSHTDIPIDEREICDIEVADLIPYQQHQKIGLDAVMMAHVIYPKVDNQCAGYSKIWIDYLRNKLKFNGLVFSDDLSMAGAKTNEDNDIKIRCDKALKAGCQVLIICNDRSSVINYLTK